MCRARRSPNASTLRTRQQQQQLLLTAGALAVVLGAAGCRHQLNTGSDSAAVRADAGPADAPRDHGSPVGDAAVADLRRDADTPPDSVIFDAKIVPDLLIDAVRPDGGVSLGWRLVEQPAGTQARCKITRIMVAGGGWCSSSLRASTHMDLHAWRIVCSGAAQTFGVCINAGYLPNLYTADSGLQTTGASVFCNRGDRLLGGSFECDGNTLKTEAPTSGTAQGFAVQCEQSKSAQAWAICARDAALLVAPYFRPSATHTTEATASCPSGTFVVGGTCGSTDPRGIRQARPSDLGGGISGWICTGYNVTATAICIGSN